MADEPENHTLHLLREMRDEIKTIRASTDRIPKIAEDVGELQREVAAMRVDQNRTNALLEDVAAIQKNQGARLNVMEARLGLIEKHIGIVDA
jgi:uncharacterized protein YdcH (DUF465 family)